MMTTTQFEMLRTPIQKCILLLIRHSLTTKVIFSILISSIGKVYKRSRVQSLSTPKTDWCLSLMIKEISLEVDAKC